MTTNRIATSLKTMRDQIMLDVLVHARESFDHDSLDWDGWLRGADRAPSGRSGDPPSKPSDRWYGRDWPRIRSILDLDIFRSASRLICAENAYCIGTTQNVIDAVVGSGGKFKCEDKGIEAYLNDWSLCYWAGGGDPWDNAPLRESSERQCLRRLIRDGEAVLHATDDEAKFIDPERMRDYSSGVDGWSYGTRHQMEPYVDVNKIEEYSFIMEGGEQAILPADEIIHVLIDGTDSTVKRGRPLYSYDVLQGFIDASRTMSAIAIGARIRAKIALLWEIPYGDAQDTEGITFGKAISNGHPNRRDPDNHLPDGTEIYTPTGLKPAALPTDYTSEQIEAVQGSLRMVGTALAQPEYMVSGDSSNANYASTRESGTPFVRRAQGLQTRLRGVALRLARFALQHAIRHDIFPDGQVRTARFNYDLPDVVVTDMAEQTRVMTEALKLGLLTSAEARTQLGFTARPEKVT